MREQMCRTRTHAICGPRCRLVGVPAPRLPPASTEFLRGKPSKLLGRADPFDGREWRQKRAADGGRALPAALASAADAPTPGFGHQKCEPQALVWSAMGQGRSWVAGERVAGETSAPST